MVDYKNSKYFDKNKTIPIEKLKEITDDFVDMGVKAIEITGGGEPSLHPDFKKYLRYLSKTPIETAIDTNGTLMSDESIALLFDTNLLWARVSIDASNKDTYSNLRHAPIEHWEKAWKTVENLVSHRKQQSIGCSFVVNSVNWKEVYDFCKIANDYGVDSARISVAFTNKGKHILSDYQSNYVEELINKADQDFNLYLPNTFSTRVESLNNKPIQDCEYCYIKDLVCIIEGSQKVYSCCSHTGTNHGIVGTLNNNRFKELWTKKEQWRRDFNVKENCKCSCIYEERNKNLSLLSVKPDHINFI